METFYDPRDIGDYETGHIIVRYLQSMDKIDVPGFVDEMTALGYDEEEVCTVLNDLVHYDRAHLEYDPETKILRHEHNWPFN